MIYYTIYFVFEKHPLSRYPKRPESLEKSRKIPQKNVDLAMRLCYTSTYLSDERFLFARIFSRRRAFFVPYREAMPAFFAGK